MPSRCLMVLGVPRSGSSCVAGVLHKLGVDMGAGHFQPDDWANPKGYFEDMRWRLATQRITGRGYSLQAAEVARIGQKQKTLYRNLARQCARSRLWGMKDPWLCFMAQFIWPILEQQGVDVRLIVTSRKREASIASVQKHLNRSYHGKGDAEHIIEAWQAGLERQLGEWNSSAYFVDYDDLTNNPREVVHELASFSFAGIGRPRADMIKIARWVTPSLNHHQGAT